jgi:4-amino-4-deoxy-L-arabinose transferase-like glycosyltransferase
MDSAVGLSRRQTAVLTAAALVLYLQAALWIRYGLHYAIGDSLVRSSNARTMVFGRHPKLATMGFVWLPLPTLSQIPFAIVFEPFGVAEFSGPASTVVFGGLTALVLMLIMRELAVPRKQSLIIVCLYVFNPVVVYTAANGMSEAPSLFFLALVALGCVKWDRRRDSVSLALIGLALAGGMAVRYEMLAAVPVVALLVGLRTGNLRRAIRTASVVAVPSVFVFSLWLAASRLIMGSAFFWRKGLAHSANPPAHAAWLPENKTFVSAAWYSVRLSLWIAPAFCVIALVVVARRQLRSFGTTIMGLGSVFPISVSYLLLRNQTWGNPRYYFPLILLGTIGVAWQLGDRGPLKAGTLGVGPRFVLIASLAFGMLTATWALNEPTIAAVESEPVVFHALLGNSFNKGLLTPEFGYLGWEKFTSGLDSRLDTAPHALVLVDERTAFPLVLFARHIKQLIVSSDQDWEPTVADGAAGVRYLVISATGPLENFKQIAARAEWKKVASSPVADLYQQVGV